MDNTTAIKDTPSEETVPSPDKWVPVNLDEYLRDNPDCRIQVSERNDSSKHGIVFSVYPISPEPHTCDFITVGGEIWAVDKAGEILEDSYTEEEYQALTQSTRRRLRSAG